MFSNSPEERKEVTSYQRYLLRSAARALNPLRMRLIYGNNKVVLTNWLFWIWWKWWVILVVECLHVFILLLLPQQLNAWGGWCQWDKGRQPSGRDWRMDCGSSSCGVVRVSTQNNAAAVFYGNSSCSHSLNCILVTLTQPGSGGGTVILSVVASHFLTVNSFWSRLKYANNYLMDSHENLCKHFLLPKW